MKLRNSTSYPNHLLRRLVSWCCREIELPVARVKLARFVKSKHKNRGTAWYREIRITLAPQSYPLVHQYRKAAPTFTYADEVEWLVSIVAHELWHLKQYKHDWKTNEAQNEFAALEILTTFRADRARLWADWLVAPKPKETAPKIPVRERNAAKAAADLERWNRKLKLAQTKVKKLRQRVRYYERSAARRAGD